MTNAEKIQAIIDNQKRLASLYRHFSRKYRMLADAVVGRDNDRLTRYQGYCRMAWYYWGMASAAGEIRLTCDLMGAKWNAEDDAERITRAEVMINDLRAGAPV